MLFPKLVFSAVPGDLLEANALWMQICHVSFTPLRVKLLRRYWKLLSRSPCAMDSSLKRSSAAFAHVFEESPSTGFKLIT